MYRYRSLLAIGLLCTLTFVAASQNGGTAPPPKYDARTFYETTSYMGASFSADAKRLLITSDGTGVFNAYSLPVDGGTPTQLTDSKTSAIMAVDYFPNDDRILYTQDEGGNELNHL